MIDSCDYPILLRNQACQRLTSFLLQLHFFALDLKPEGLRAFIYSISYNHIQWKPYPLLSTLDKLPLSTLETYSVH